MPLISISDIAGVNLNSVSYDVLKIDGVTVWEKLKDDLSFNYVGYDSEGRPDGAVDFDGVAVEYFVGKLKYTYFKQSPNIPTTAEEYYDKWIKPSTLDLGTTGFIRVTSSNISSYVTVGTTPVYDVVDSKDHADGYNFDSVYCGAFNEQYYNYDFSTRISPSDPSQQIIPDDIVVPETYKGVPITGICAQAFSGGFEVTSSGGSSIWNNYSQAAYIKSIALPKTITDIYASGIRLLEQLTKDIVLPEGLTILNPSVLNNCSQPSKKYIIPKSALLSLLTNSIVWDGASSQVSHSNIYTLVIQNPNVELMSNSNAFRYAKTVEFTKDVQSITGCLGYNGLPTNLVFRHTNSDAITLSLSKPKSATAVNIYTDNDYLKTFDWSSMNYTATIYPLSDYVE